MYVLIFLHKIYKLLSGCRHIAGSKIVAGIFEHE